MLHDPEHIETSPAEDQTDLPGPDTEILRRLGGELAAIAALPVHAEKAHLWDSLNSLKSVRPLVWINEIPWHEMNADDELTLQCTSNHARRMESGMRHTLYQWKHFPCDMVVSDFMASPLAIRSTSFGIVEDVDAIKQDDDSYIKSRHFIPQIEEPEDIEKIRMPVVTHDEAATENRFQALTELFRDVMPVRKIGQTHIWFTPWDFLIRWWGVEQAMMDLVMRPDMVHAAVDRMVDAWMLELDQFEQLNVLALDNRNVRVGSGGYGYCSELPGADYDGESVKPNNMWGCSNAQIFSEVSPDMHWEFAIEHDMRWMERWGLNYYGCCEPLHNKLDLMRKIPNLRKISVSPWSDIRKVSEELGGDYALSIKPNPAILAEDSWHPERARAEIREMLDQTGPECHVELILKDISTVRYEPQRLWEWADIAMAEVTQREP